MAAGRKTLIGVIPPRRKTQIGVIPARRQKETGVIPARRKTQIAVIPPRRQTPIGVIPARRKARVESIRGPLDPTPAARAGMTGRERCAGWGDGAGALRGLG